MCESLTTVGAHGKKPYACIGYRADDFLKDKAYMSPMAQHSSVAGRGSVMCLDIVAIFYFLMSIFNMSLSDVSEWVASVESYGKK